MPHHPHDLKNASDRKDQPRPEQTKQERKRDENEDDVIIFRDFAAI